jgi:hypothetical protein
LDEVIPISNEDVCVRLNKMYSYLFRSLCDSSFPNVLIGNPVLLLGDESFWIPDYPRGNDDASWRIIEKINSFIVD